MCSGIVPDVEKARNRGRPARVDADTIADAVIEIGFADITMRRVAEHLGVSLPGLYHHVKGKEDLLRLAAQRSVEQRAAPDYTGQHWATWLREWAWYIRQSMGTHPEMLEQFTAGALDDQRQLFVVARVLDVLVDLGLTPKDALTVWAAVTNLALGDAVEIYRERAMSNHGRPWPARVFSLIARSPVEEHVTLRALAAAGVIPTAEGDFDRRLDLLLIGVANRFSLDLPA
jgi:AcrR family transcriptional regulator